MTALEKFPCRGRFLHAGRYRREPSFSSLHQNQDGLAGFSDEKQQRLLAQILAEAVFAHLLVKSEVIGALSVE
jgi:hypothetical protein